MRSRRFGKATDEALAMFKAEKLAALEQLQASMGELEQQAEKAMEDPFVRSAADEFFRGLDEGDAVKAYMGFAKLKRQVGRKGVKNPGALAAFIGRRKYGKKKFQKYAGKGKKMKGVRAK